MIDNKSIPHEDVNDIGNKQDYLGIEIGLPRGPDDELRHATVERIFKDIEGYQLEEETIIHS